MSETQLFFDIDTLRTEQAAGGKAYLEFLRIPAMSAGVYALRAGSEDQQSPHRQDELYYVVRGRARMKAGGEQDREVTVGSVIFVTANVEHRSYDISEDLLVLVFFAPAEN